MDRIIFLDVDGVLNCPEDWDGPNAADIETLDPIKCDRFARIVRETGAIVVLSSTWRKIPGPGLERLKDWLRERGAPIQSETPILGMDRGFEIEKWLADHRNIFPNPRFVILDDTPDMLVEQFSFFVETDPKVGLTDADAEKAIGILKS